jgi:hypothetical protein
MFGMVEQSVRWNFNSFWRRGSIVIWSAVSAPAMPTALEPPALAVALVVAALVLADHNGNVVAGTYGTPIDQAFWSGRFGQLTDKLGTNGLSCRHSTNDAPPRQAAAWTISPTIFSDAKSSRSGWPEGRSSSRACVWPESAARPDRPRDPAWKWRETTTRWRHRHFSGQTPFWHTEEPNVQLSKMR